MHFLLLVSLLFNSTKIQKANTVLGRVVYEYNYVGNTKFIEMYFSSDSYAYRITNNWDTTLTITADSIFAPIPEKINKDIKAINKYVDNHRLMIKGIEKNELFELGPFSKEDGYCNIIKLGEMAWSLNNRDTIIMGKQYNMANGLYLKNKNKYLACYDANLPITYAPLQFTGLPGLMVYLKNLDNNNTLQMVYLEYPLKNNHAASLFSASDGLKKLTSEEINKMESKKSAELKKLIDNLKPGDAMPFQQINENNN